MTKRSRDEGDNTTYLLAILDLADDPFLPTFEKSGWLQHLGEQSLPVELRNKKAIVLAVTLFGSPDVPVPLNRIPARFLRGADLTTDLRSRAALIPGAAALSH